MEKLSLEGPLLWYKLCLSHVCWTAMFFIDKTMKMTWLQHVAVMVILLSFHIEADCVTDKEFWVSMTSLIIVTR